MQKIKRYFLQHNICFHLCALVLWLWGLTLIIVLVMGLLISLREGLDYALYPRKFIPDVFMFSNYAEAIRTLSFGTTSYLDMIWNSIWFTFGTTFMKVLATTLCAYTVAKYNFPGRKVFYGFIIVQLMLPIYGQTTANYKLLSTMGMVDNGWFLLAQGAGHGMYFLIMYSYFENLSSMYMEAARIDGASGWKTLTKITIPCVMPSITICTFLTLTNSFKLFDQNLALNNGQPYIFQSDGSIIHSTEMLALNIYNSFYLNANSRGVGQAKAVLFFILVAAIGLIQLRYTRKKEVQQ